MTEKIISSCEQCPFHWPEGMGRVCRSPGGPHIFSILTVWQPKGGWLYETPPWWCPLREGVVWKVEIEPPKEIDRDD